MDKVTAYWTVTVQRTAVLGRHACCLSVTGRIIVFSSNIMRNPNSVIVEICQVGPIRVYVATTVKIKGKTFSIVETTVLAFIDSISSGNVCSIVCVRPNECLKCILKIYIIKSNKISPHYGRVWETNFDEK